MLDTDIKTSSSGVGDVCTCTVPQMSSISHHAPQLTVTWLLTVPRWNPLLLRTLWLQETETQLKLTSKRGIDWFALKVQRVDRLQVRTNLGFSRYHRDSASISQLCFFHVTFILRQILLISVVKMTTSSARLIIFLQFSIPVEREPLSPNGSS